MKFTCVLFMAATIPCSAAITPLFTIGTDNNSSNEFSREDRDTDADNGSPTELDDHFYAPNEPFENFERALTTSDPINVVHFPLTAAQATTTGTIWMRIDFLNSSGGDIHEISFSFNGGSPSYTTMAFESYESFTFEIPTNNLNLTAGDNTLKIERTGITSSAIILIDYITATIDPTALLDMDGDTIPRFWEEQNHFSDTDGSDAASDIDDDGLTNLAEYNKGTNPRLADTDHDGLSDGAETISDPLDPDSDDDGLRDGEEISTNPTDSDTDNDGASDGWETAIGYNPANINDTPPAWSGAIGVNFRSQAEPELGIWNDITPTGFIPQIHWNHTAPLRDFGVSLDTPLLTGSTADISFPNAGMLVDSSGAVTTMTLSFEHDGVESSRNRGTPAAALLHGYLANEAYEDNGVDVLRPAKVTLGNIPYTNYHIYLYLSTDRLDTEATARLNGQESTDQLVRPIGIAPTDSFIENGPFAGEEPPFANVVAFENLSGSSQVLELFQTSRETGIAAVQIVDVDVDSNNNNLPDYWEFRHRIHATANNDPDSDDLNHAAEFAAGSNPNLADTDGDGLRDDAEVAAGTNPSYGDTDGDGLSDYDELTAELPSNPTLANTDGDALNDQEEQEAFADPNDSDFAHPPVPGYPGTDQFLWEITDLQLIVDHTVPREISSSSRHTIARWETRNLSHPDFNRIGFYLVEENGTLGYQVSVSDVSRGGFSYIDSRDRTRGLSYSDYTTDLFPLLGFSSVGSCDTSDPITLRFAVSKAGNIRTATISIINQNTGARVAERIFENVIQHATIENQTAIWGYDDDEDPGSSRILLDAGISLYRTKTPIDSLPAFAHCKDTDNDGMPDAWETTRNLNPNSATDASLDPDTDSLSNVQEFLAGTKHDDNDSDGDGVPDNIELDQNTNPNSTQSKPLFYSQAPRSGGDLDNNGLPDLWEAFYQSADLTPGLDSDGDGHTNLEESLLGTDPLDGSSYFRLSITPSAPGEATLQYPRLTTKRQTLMSSTGLTGFTLHPQSPAALGDLYSLTVPASTRQFFQVELADMDLDSDGISDWAEKLLGTSISSESSLSRPVSYDSTGNGQPDSFLSGDYAVFSSFFQERDNLLNGSTAPTTSSQNASRLLLQASFGPTFTDLQTVESMGIAAWIDDQIQNQPATRHSEYIAQITADLNGPRTDRTYDFDDNDEVVEDTNLQTAFARAAISGPDQLRQRVAFALSQILVVSRQDDNIDDKVQGLADYYDLFVDHAFGNYEDLLLKVTMHPIMGRYLSSVGNQKADPIKGRFPDENYGREVKQLFSVGLWQLNPDGTRKTDASGNPIPTYNNDDITEIARVFTGLWYGKQRYGSGGSLDLNYLLPMEMHPEFHDFQEKRILNGYVIPARTPSVENGLQDIRDTIRLLVNHPSCAPFISRQLIQFLVTSNPSPAYVERISTVFSNTRGNLGAVVKAILLDPEARDPAKLLDQSYGIFREPVIRAMHLARLMKLNRNGNVLWFDDGNFYEDTLQTPLLAPTVFNFYRPDYTPSGVLDQNNLDGPTFEILDSYISVALPNHFWDIVDEGFDYRDYQFSPDLGDFLPLVSDAEALVDRLSLLICGGSMSAKTRQLIISGINNTDPDDPAGRARVALYLSIMSPDGAVQR